MKTAELGPMVPVPTLRNLARLPYASAYVDKLSKIAFTSFTFVKIFYTV